jgi:hypothetical protein
MDWRDVARERGIPVWRWCMAWWRDSAGQWHEPLPVIHVDSATRVPAIDDPDTQPAYLRRLAVRLGCPEGVAEEG